MAISVGIIILSFFVSSWMIIHFGINPDSGGSPPIDRRVISIRLVMTGVLFHVCDNDSIVVVELWMKNMNIVNVIVM